MTWLQKLLLIEAPANTSLQAAELSLRGVFPLWVAALLLAICGAGIFYLYLHERAGLSLARRIVLALLRLAVVAVVLLLLLRPVLLAEFHGERPRDVVLLIDNSQSMSQRDQRFSTADRLRAAIAKGLLPPGSVTDSARLADIPPEPLKEPDRAQLVKGVLVNSNLKLIDGLKTRGPLQPYLFGRRLLMPTEQESAAEEATSVLTKRLLSSLKADESQTALADAIHEMLVRGGGDLPAAIVVITDGRDNASKLTLEEAAQECRDKGVPLHIYGVGSTEGGILQLREAAIPRTVFVDEKPEVRDDLVEVPVRWRFRGFKQGTVLLTLALDNQIILRVYSVREGPDGKALVTWKDDENVPRQIAIREGEDVADVVKFVPEKGREGQRRFVATIKLRDREAFQDQVERPVLVKNSKVKVLYVENLPRREYKFIQPVLDRDRRVLARFFLIEGDPRLAEAKPDPISGSLFLDAFPETFPDPSPRDPDKRAYDLLILGDVPLSALGKQGTQQIQKFVKEGGGLIVLAGRQHAPAEYLDTPLAEVLPVEFVRKEFKAEADGTRAQSFVPLLTYDGEQSNMLALADKQDDNLRFWKEDLWKDAKGFYWHYPVTGLRQGATALLVHPEMKTGQKPDEKAMPLLATHYYGKGEVLFVAVDETWRWRHNTGDRLTARFWGQVVAQLGLPHLLGNSQRVQLELERSEAVLGRPGSVKARLLNEKYEPLTAETVPATLVHLDARDGDPRSRPIELRRIKSLPGEYRATLPHDTPGRFELRVDKGVSVESAALHYRVDLPPRHELEVAGIAAESLRNAAQTSGGKFYREEDLGQLVEQVEQRKVSFVQRQEILLWNPLTLLLFVGLVTAEWVLRKFSNLS